MNAIVIVEFLVVLAYGQIFMHVPDAPNIGLYWQDEHVAQGFAWTPKATAFGVPDDDGYDLVRVTRSEDDAVSPDALWAVQVPFEVGKQGIETGGVGMMYPAAVPEGSYKVIFQASRAPKGTPAEDGEMVNRILEVRFVPSNGTANFRVLKKGGYLTTDKVLKTDAEFAP